jgi:hypothetical protein
MTSDFRTSASPGSAELKMLKMYADVGTSNTVS